MALKINSSTGRTGGNRISGMGALEVFHFTSSKRKENTGYYIKENSKKNKAMNLQTGKVILFSDHEVGTPVDAEFTVKGQ